MPDLFDNASAEILGEFMTGLFHGAEALRNEFEGASDRAAALVAGAFLDEILGELLREFLVGDPKNDKKIFEGTGPLATFSAKIDITYRLGLISAREHQMIHVIRSIRNDFAHKSSGVSFENQSISARCKNIEMPLTMLTPKVFTLTLSGKVPPLPTIEKADSSDARAVFQESVITLSHILESRIVDAQLSRRTSPPAFVAAHEPIERLGARLQDLIERYQSFFDSEVLSPEEKYEIAKNLRKYQALLSVQQNSARQIKAVHEALSRQQP
jgi:DNA-binding MltR family transcriptional regulator